MKQIIDFLLYLVCFMVFWIAVFMGSTESRADTFVNLNVSAYHFDRDAVKTYNFNERNYGAGVHYTTGDTGVMGGMYTNSILRPSWYLLATYTPINLGNTHVGVIGGGVSGYQLAPVIPAVGLFLRYSVGRYGFNVIATPDVKEYAIYGFVGLQLSFKI